ncbi:MAG: stalk domain-containing protein [Defluviitaleaceae bacterium]|nr:stalk domain-containing protein [Defluviitaleaceae bacterium]
MKKYFAAVILLVLIFPAKTAAAIGVEFDQRIVTFDGYEPVIIDAVVLVPVRTLFEEMGFCVEWDEVTVTLTGSGHVVVIVPSSDIFTVNGEAFRSEGPARNIDGRVFVPIADVIPSINYGIGRDGFGAETTFIRIGVPIDFENFGQGIFDEINLRRAEYGLAPLLWCDDLAETARAGYGWSTGFQPAMRISAPDVLVQSFMSRNYYRYLRAAMLCPDATYIGLAYEHRGWGRSSPLNFLFDNAP